MRSRPLSNLQKCFMCRPVFQPTYDVFKFPIILFSGALQRALTRVFPSLVFARDGRERNSFIVCNYCFFYSLFLEKKRVPRLPCPCAREGNQSVCDCARLSVDERYLGSSCSPRQTVPLASHSLTPSDCCKAGKKLVGIRAAPSFSTKCALEQILSDKTQ